MGILDNLENSDFFGDDEKELPFSWNQPCYHTHGDQQIQYEHTAIAEIDNMGRVNTWEQPDLSL